MPDDLHMPRDHQRVLAALQHCRGRRQAVSNADLAATLGLNPRLLRRVIKELAEQFGQPIGTAYGSEAGGHYWIVDPAERRATVDALLRHGASLFKRAHSLDRAAARATLGQLEMELPS